MIAVLPLARAAPLEPDTILRRSDAIRNPGEAFVMDVEVASPDDTRKFEVAIKGGNRTHVKLVAPARDRGRDLLMVDENMWAFVPALKRAVRVNLSQKLSGEAANGDISRMRWADDYTARVETETPKEWVLLLDAKKKGLTYDKIRAWVEKGTFRPLRAEYLTLAGKTLKRATFGVYRTLAGRERPSQIAIEDAVRPEQKSTIRITAMKTEALPDSRFNLERFQGR